MAAVLEGHLDLGIEERLVVQLGEEMRAADRRRLDLDEQHALDLLVGHDAAEREPRPHSHDERRPRMRMEEHGKVPEHVLVVDVGKRVGRLDLAVEPDRASRPRFEDGHDRRSPLPVVEHLGPAQSRAHVHRSVGQPVAGRQRVLEPAEEMGIPHAGATRRHECEAAGDHRARDTEQARALRREQERAVREDDGARPEHRALEPERGDEHVAGEDRTHDGAERVEHEHARRRATRRETERRRRLPRHGERHSEQERRDEQDGERGEERRRDARPLGAAVEEEVPGHDAIGERRDRLRRERAPDPGEHEDGRELA